MSDNEATKLVPVLNVPNILTMIRLAAVPVLAVMLLTHPHDVTWRFASTMVFIAAIITDAFDGNIARKYGLVTNWGKIWDSVADKAITGVAWIGLSWVGEIPWWITIVILGREWGITYMRARMLKYGVMAARKGGKIKTVVQSLAIPLFMIVIPGIGIWFTSVRWGLLLCALVLTVATGVDYVFEAKRLKAAAIAAGGPVDANGKLL